MKSILAVFLLFTGFDTSAAPIQCWKQSNVLLSNVLKSKTLVGSYFRQSATARAVSIALPDGETEIQEEFNYQNAEGENSVTIKLARGLCELRSVVHNVPL